MNYRWTGVALRVWCLFISIPAWSEFRKVSVRAEAESSHIPSLQFLKVKKDDIVNLTSCGPKAKWHRSDIRLAVMPSSSLTFTIQHENQSGWYWCEGADRRSAHWIITVMIPPVITIPNAIMIYNCKGHRLILSCPAIAYPAPKFSWTFSQQDSMKRQLLASADNSCQLELPASSSKREGHYMCEVSNDAGRSSVQMIVKKAKDCNGPQLLLEGPHVVNEGAELAINCSVNTSYPVTLSWLHDNVKISLQNRRRRILQANSSFTSANGELKYFFSTSLWMTDLDQNYSGSYSCILHNDSSSQLLDAKSTYVTVNVPLTFLSQPRHLNISEGATVVFECFAHGWPRPQTWWTFGHRLSQLTQLSANSSSNVDILEDSRWLVVRQVSQFAVGYYVCQSQAAGGCKHSQINQIGLAIQETRPSPSLTPSNPYTTTLGRRLFFTEPHDQWTGHFHFVSSDSFPLTKENTEKAKEELVLTVLAILSTFIGGAVLLLVSCLIHRQLKRVRESQVQHNEGGRRQFGVINRLFYAEDMAVDHGLSFSLLSLYLGNQSNLSSGDVSPHSQDSDEEQPTADACELPIETPTSPCSNGTASSPNSPGSPGTGDTTPAVQITTAKFHELEQAMRQLDEQLRLSVGITLDTSEALPLTPDNNTPMLTQEEPTSDTQSPHSQLPGDVTTPAAASTLPEEPNSSKPAPSVDYFESVPVVAAGGLLLRTARFPSRSDPPELEQTAALSAS